MDRRSLLAVNTDLNRLDHPQPDAPPEKRVAYHERYLSLMRELWALQDTPEWVRHRISSRVKAAIAAARSAVPVNTEENPDA